MAEATTDIQGTGRAADGADSAPTDLEQSVDRLVREIDEAVENIEQRFSDGPDDDLSKAPGPCAIDGAAMAPEEIGGPNPELPEPPTAPAATDEPEVAAPRAAADEPIEEPPGAEPTPATAGQGPPPGEDDLSTEVDRLIAEAQSSVDETPPHTAPATAAPAPVPEGPPATSIDDLDAQLAAEADVGDDDDDLNGDFAPPTPAEAPADEEAASVAQEVQQVVDRVSAGILPDGSLPNANDPAADPAQTPATAGDGLIVRVRRALGPAETPARLAVQTADAASRVVSAPLLRLGPATRDTIGWIGVNTLFLALCVWVYVLLR